MTKDIKETKKKILRTLANEREKVYLVFQRFREDNEGIDSTYFDDDKGANLLEVFDSEKKAEDFINELFKDYNAEHPENTKKENKQVWESDFNTFINVMEIH